MFERERCSPPVTVATDLRVDRFFTMTRKFVLFSPLLSSMIEPLNAKIGVTSLTLIPLIAIDGAAAAGALVHPSPEIATVAARLNGHDKGLSAGDCYIARITRLSDQLELPTIGEDYHRNVATDSVEREQIADTVYP